MRGSQNCLIQLPCREGDLESFQACPTVSKSSAQKSSQLLPGRSSAFLPLWARPCTLPKGSCSERRCSQSSGLRAPGTGQRCLSATCHNHRAQPQAGKEYRGSGISPSATLPNHLSNSSSCARSSWQQRLGHPHGLLCCAEERAKLEERTQGSPEPRNSVRTPSYVHRDWRP